MLTRCLGVLVAALCAVALAGPARAAAAAPPPIENVWVILLENKTFEESFGPDSEAPYLARTLRSQGQLLTNYYGIGHFSLTNYIALISGQAPNSATQADCIGRFADIVPATPADSGQIVGTGCVYPARVKTIANQLDDAGLRWRGYMEDMRTPCERPPIGTRDQTQRATVDSQYAVRHNPFVYFRSIINGVTCARNDVPLKRLRKDVRRARTTPNFALITPDLCSDGHDTPCIDGRPGGLKSIDAFLREWVPRILASPGFTKRGMLVITYDESEGLSEEESTACCNEPTGPNVSQPGITGLGGGRTGALVISPWARPGSTNPTPYNHYSLLRSMENLFGLSHLGYAGQRGLKPFGADVYNGSGCMPASSGRVVSGLRLNGRTLRFQALRDGRVRIRVRKGGALSSIGPGRVTACKRYAVTLPAGASRVAVSADGRRTVFDL